MQNNSHISDSLLHSNTVSAAGNEKAATFILLEHLAEVDRRRLYATLAYSSLWEYVHKALGYSEAQASDRVNAMRVMVKVPEIRGLLETGKLTLTSTAKLGTHAKREKLKPAETALLLPDIQGKSSREVERVLLSHSTLTEEAKKPDRVRLVTPQLTRITIEVDEDFLSLLQSVKDLKGDPTLSCQEAFAIGMKEFVKQRSLLKVEPQSQTEKVARAPRIHGTRKVTAKSPLTQSRYIPIQNRRKILARSQGSCEFVDHQTGRRCETKSGLQFDHIHPHAKGGTSDVENLRQVCRTHNLLYAAQHFGQAQMQPFFRL